MSTPQPDSALVGGPLFSIAAAQRPPFFIDTSTLIYLEKTAILADVCQLFAPVTIRPVLTEFGREIDGVRILNDDLASGDTDAALFSLIRRYRGVLLSEDGDLLRRADRSGLWYYNSLMLICGLCYHGVLDCRQGADRMERLMSFARYGKAVRCHGRRVFARICGHRHGTAEDKEHS